MKKVWGIYEQFDRHEDSLRLVKIFPDENEAINFMKTHNFIIDSSYWWGDIYKYQRKEILL